VYRATTENTPCTAEIGMATMSRYAARVAQMGPCRFVCAASKHRTGYIRRPAACNPDARFSISRDARNLPRNRGYFGRRLVTAMGDGRYQTTLRRGQKNNNRGGLAASFCSAKGLPAPLSALKGDALHLVPYNTRLTRIDDPRNMDMRERSCRPREHG